MNERMLLFGDKLQYMTMEVSGLPPGERRHFRKAEVRARRIPKLLRRQDARGNIRFYDPPIPMRVEGSLFFDISRAHGQSPRTADAASTYAGDLRGPPDFRYRIRTRADGAIGQHKRPPHRTCRYPAAIHQNRFLGYSQFLSRKGSQLIRESGSGQEHFNLVAILRSALHKRHPQHE